jgi:phage regulator Rha-like protein
MENRIDKVKEVIEKDGLITKSRYRTFLDRRSYLYAMLNKNGMSLVEIGRLFNKNHATIINGIKKHHAYTRFKDELYLHNVKEYREIFYEPKKIHVDLIEKDEKKYNGSQLIADILECKNTTELQDIKRKLLNEEYLFTEATYYK